ncbi:hypothetical protein C2W62_12065 [Candidatus Entotheonella serta]|nr:hypothetical protein C2W62_12065 [Candidatus Entotheonella serta]
MCRDHVTYLLLTTALLLTLSACATLNQAECQQANWHTIGFEDGAKGELPSRIGRHRKACAKHGVSPDLAAYQAGHSDGLSQFCTELNGFSRGRAGWSDNGVCSPALYPQFEVGYRKGAELHAAKEALSRAKAALASHERDLDRIDKQIVTTEQQIVSADTLESKRHKLLSKLKKLQRRHANLESELPYLRHEIDDKAFYYNDLRRRYAY